MKGSVEVKLRGCIAVLALALWLPAAGRAQNAAKAPAPAPAGKRPVIEIPVTSFNFGDLYHQDQYTHEFTVRNTGSAELLIEDVKPG